MAKKKKSNPGWQDDEDTDLNNPFAAALAGRKRAPAPPKPKPDTRPASSADPKPPARAVVRLERKGRGGKKVTVVSHLDLSPAALETWSTGLRKQLGCGSSVEDDTLVFQGDQRKRLRKLLEDRGVRNVTVS